MYPPFGPVIFQLGSFALHWYGVIIVVAILAAASVASHYVSCHGQSSNSIWDMLLWVLIPALMGERLYYVFIQSPRGPNGLGQYLANPIEILEIWKGGMHIYGAFIFGGIALVLYARIRKLPLPLYLDAAGLALPLGQAIGRWANFINQELYGPPTTLPWGLRIDAAHRIPPYNDTTLYPDSVRFQPLFLYESLANLIGFALIFWISRRFEKRLRAGDLFLIYLIWYPLVRFCLEFFRTDSWFFSVFGLHFNVVHILSVITIIAAATILFIRHRTQPQIAVLQSAGDTPVAEDREITVVKDEAVVAHSSQDNNEHIDQLKEGVTSNKHGEAADLEASNTKTEGVKAES